MGFGKTNDDDLCYLYMLMISLVLGYVMSELIEFNCLSSQKENPMNKSLQTKRKQSINKQNGVSQDSNLCSRR